MQNLIDQIGNRLKKARETAGLSLDDVADCVSVTRTRIWQIEKGKVANPTLNTLRSLAKFYGIPLEKLLYEKNFITDFKPKVARVARIAETLTKEQIEETIEFIRLLKKKPEPDEDFLS